MLPYIRPTLCCPMSDLPYVGPTLHHPTLDLPYVRPTLHWTYPTSDLPYSALHQTCPTLVTYPMPPYTYSTPSSLSICKLSLAATPSAPLLNPQVHERFLGRFLTALRTLKYIQFHLSDSRKCCY